MEIINNIGITNIVLGIVGFVLIIVFFVKRSASSRGQKALDSNKDGQSAAYYQKKQNNDQKLTLQEKLELSWKFLYEITEIVVNKFSPQDRQTVQEIGKNLADGGMKYDHVIDLGIKPEVNRVQNLEHEKKQDQSIGR